MPENLQNNPWFLLVVALLLAGGLIYFGRTVWPNTVEMEQINQTIVENITKLQKEVNEGRELEARLPELEREIKSKRNELESLKKIIPSDSEAQDLIRKLERMAAETNILVQTFQPQAQVAKDFYFEWPIAIAVTGSYHNLGKFFSKISNYARIINVQNIVLNAARDTKNPTQTLSANFQALTYVYKEDKK
jgi:type IV pilus assembly protein PilO